MQRLRVIVFLLGVFLCPTTAVAQTAQYLPFGAWQRLNIAKSTRLSQALQASFNPANEANSRRPVLPGLRSTDVELLVDSLLRKFPRKLSGSRLKARQVIQRRNLAGPGGQGQLRGYLAEAVFLEKNPEWQYVQKANAPQHDVYKLTLDGKPPINGQVKTYKDYSASKYAAAMRRDHLAHQFIVPDDHVTPIKDYWRAEAERLERTGNTAGVKEAWRNYGRVRGLGVTTSELDTMMQKAARSLLRERVAGYVSLGAAAAVGIVPPAWEWSQGRLTNDQFVTQVARSSSILGGAVGADYLLSRFADGALRGTVRGTIIVGTIIVAIDTGWQIYEYGGTRAFNEAEFWVGLGGSVTATTLGLAVGIPVGASVTAAAAGTGPSAPVIGAVAGFVSGGLAGAIGYFGGSSATRWTLGLVAPEMLRKPEQQALSMVRDKLDSKLRIVQSP